MTLEVHVKPSAKTQKVEKMSEGIYNVWVKEPAKDNRANFELISIISKHFNVPSSSVRIVRGQKSRVKTVVLH